MANKPTFTARLNEWAGNQVAKMIWAGRMRKNPARDTIPYAKLMSIGGQRYTRDRPMVKPTPSNLRRFSRTVYARRAINYVKNTVVGLKWEVVAKPDVTETGELKRQIETVTNCFENPNRDDSFRTFIEQIAEDILICGAGAIEQEIGAHEVRPLWMWPVDALSIEVYAAWDGERNSPRYAQTMGYGNVGGVKGVELMNDQLIYIRKDPATDNPFGLGCLEVAFGSINRLLSTADYAGNVAGNAQPANLLQFPGMDPSQLDRVREFWRNEIEGQGQTPLFGGSDEIKVLALRGATDEALYLKYQEFLIREIATAFEISPGVLGIEHDVNRSTAEVSTDRDWQSAIIPLATNIQSYLNREAIKARLGYSQVQFQWLGIDRDDEEMLANIHKQYYDINTLTPNEIREKLGREPSDSPWADMHAADVQIAIQAARSMGQDLDPDLPAGAAPGASKKPKPTPGKPTKPKPEKDQS